MRNFDDQLQDLLQKIARMGWLAESMIQNAVRGMIAGDQTLAGQVFEKERQVNALQVEVDDTAVRLTVLQQPVARDARFLFMASRIGGELERIADQAVNIVQNTGHLSDRPLAEPLVDVPLMAQMARKMVRDSLTAMIDRNMDLADRVLMDEKEVDAFRDRIFKALVARMAVDPPAVQGAMSLILIARNLERVGDHATNIAEEVIYWINGRDVRHRQTLRAEDNRLDETREAGQ
jgi:phosphate transport system protein